MNTGTLGLVKNSQVFKVPVSHEYRHFGYLHMGTFTWVPFTWVTFTWAPSHGYPMPVNMMKKLRGLLKP